MFQFQLLTSEDIHEIIPLVKLINKSCTDELLFQRFEEMFMQNYECVGVLSNEKTHWLLRFYGFKRVITREDRLNQTMWLFFLNTEVKDWVKSSLIFVLKELLIKGFDAMELNCYLENEQGQKFLGRIGFCKNLGIILFYPFQTRKHKM